MYQTQMDQPMMNRFDSGFMDGISSSPHNDSGMSSREYSNISTDSAMDLDSPRQSILVRPSGGDNGTAVVTAGLKISNGNGGWTYSAQAYANVDDIDNNGRHTASLTWEDNGSSKEAWEDNGRSKEASSNGLLRSSSREVGRVEIRPKGDPGPDSQQGMGQEFCGMGSRGQTVFGGSAPGPCRLQQQEVPPYPRPVNNSFQIFVKDMRGHSHPFIVKPTNSVDELMRMIEHKLGMPPDQQRLNYAGKNLYQGHKLCEYELKPECTVHLTGRLRGG